MISGLAGSVVLLLVLLVVVLALLLRSMEYDRDTQARISKKSSESLPAIVDLANQLLDFAREFGQIEGPFLGLDSLDKDLTENFPDLARLHKHVPALIEVIEVASDRNYPDLCLPAVQALSRLEDGATIVVPILKSIAEDRNSRSREDAETALENIRTTLREAIPALEEAAKHDDSRVATEAKLVLARIEHMLDVKLQEPTVEDHKE